MRVRICVVLAAVVAALAAARADAQTKIAPLDPVRTVHVGTVNQASDAGLYVAIEKGYFAELGLKIELVTFTNAATMIAPLGSGELDVGGGAVSAGLWNAELRKIGVRAVADKGSTRAGWSYFSLVTKKDGPIQRCEDLKGKSISNASLSNGVLHAIELWLVKCGLSLADVDVKTLGYPEVVPALINGGIAAGHLGEPLLSANLANGTIRVLARQDEMRPSTRWRCSISRRNSGLTARRRVASCSPICAASRIILPPTPRARRPPTGSST